MMPEVCFGPLSEGQYCKYMSCVFPVGVGSAACTAISSHYLSFTPDGITVAPFGTTTHKKSLPSFAWSHKHIFKGVSLLEPVARHLSGRVVGPSGAASIVGETMN